MNKTDRLIKAKDLLQQAFLLAGQHEGQQVSEARSHIKQAMIKLEQMSKKSQMNKQQNQNQAHNWWNNVVAGTTQISAGQHSQESHVKSLKQLNDLISEEQKKLAELEKMSTTNVTNQDLLSD